MTNGAGDGALVPVGLQDQTKELDLCDEEEENALDFNNKTLDLRNAQINVDQGSEVTIGQVTNILGPLTIVARPEGGWPQDVVNKALKKPENAKILEPPSQKFEFRDKKLIIFTATLVVCLLTVGVTIAVLVTQKNSLPNKPSNEDHKQEVTTPEPKENDCQGLSTFGRESWGGRPSGANTKPLPHPTPLVIISHSGTDFCKHFYECALQVKTFQNSHVNNGSPDVGYNFLIGGDGNVFIGRGWDIRNFHQDNSLGICFIGNYIFDELTPKMIQQAKALLNCGVELGKLSANYKLVPHNQTFNTDSPGRNIVKEVKTWSHYTNKTYF